MFLQYLRASFAFRAGLWLAVAGALPAFFAVQDGARAHRRLQDFYAVRATVTRKTVQSGRGGPSYFFQVKYLDRAGHDHEQRVQAAGIDYRLSRVGDQVMVYLSGADPEDAWLVSAGEPSYKKGLQTGAIALVFFLPLPLALVWLWRRARALKKGWPHKGRVEKVVKDSGKWMSRKYTDYLVWSCTGPEGEPRRGKSIRMPHSLGKRWKTGDQITVYIDLATPLFAEVDVYNLRPAQAPTRAAKW